MKKMKKIYILFIVIILVIIPNLVNAHSGMTDSTGGHYDYSTGEYHYHHGYPEHQHIDGICPYEKDWSKILPVTCSQCGTITNYKNGIYCLECANRLIPQNLNLYAVNYIDSMKTREDYENEIKRLNTTIENYKSVQKDLNKENDQLYETIDSIKTKSNIVVIFLIITILIVLLSKKVK